MNVNTKILKKVIIVSILCHVFIYYLSPSEDFSITRDEAFKIIKKNSLPCDNVAQIIRLRYKTRIGCEVKDDYLQYEIYNDSKNNKIVRAIQTKQ